MYTLAISLGIETCFKPVFWVAMTIPQAEWLNNTRFIFSWFWRLEVQDQGAIRVGFQWDFWARPWPPSCCVLTWNFFCALAETERERGLWCLFLSVQGHHHIGITVTTSLKFFSPNRVTLEVRALTHEFRRGEMGNTISSITKSLYLYTMSFFLFWSLVVLVLVAVWGFR